MAERAMFAPRYNFASDEEEPAGEEQPQPTDDIIP